MKRLLLPLMLLLIFAIAASGCSQAAAGAETPPVVETGVDAEAWALIPAGDFLMGQHDHETAVDYDYEMMVTDVTTEQFANYLNEALAADVVSLKGQEIVGYYPGDEFHAHEHEVEIGAGDWVHLSLADEELRLDFDGKEFQARTGYENHPMVKVSWFGAKAYCEFYGGRLPTEVEWEKGARGVDGRPYPWGDDIKRNNANYYSSHDLFEKIAGLGDTTPVGFYSGLSVDGYETLDSPSPYGLYDMAGNVAQWTADVYEGTHMRYMRGGSKADYGYNLRVWSRNSAGPEYMSTNVGFRCVRD